MQPLAGGDEFVGWGQAGVVSELSRTGALTFDMHFAQPANSYRAFRIVWHAQPASAPALTAIRSGDDGTSLSASWNGATDVASWRVRAGASAAALGLIRTYPSQGFETAISAPTVAPFVSVQALSARGVVLGTSAVVHAGG